MIRDEMLMPLAERPLRVDVIFSWVRSWPSAFQVPVNNGQGYFF